MASTLHHMSGETDKSELDLFSLPPTQMCIEQGQNIPYKPLASLQDQAPIEFVVPGRGDEYIDLAHTVIKIKAQVLNGDGTALVEDINVSTINNFLHSLFSQVDVHLNQKLVSPPANTYAYRSYLETLLSYGPAAKNSHLTSALYYKDTADAMDVIVGNAGATTRAEYIEESKMIELSGPLCCDVFNIDKYLINGVELKVKLVRSRDTFSLMAVGDGIDAQATFKVKIVDATLIVRKVKIQPSTLMEHSQRMAKESAKYPFTRVETKVLTIPSNVQSKTLDNIFLGVQPKRVVVGFVSNRAFNGDLTLNPFNFRHFNLSYLALYIDGEQIPTQPLQPVYASQQYLDCYQTLFSGTGIHYQDDGNDISRKEYPNGYCLYAFDLTPDLAASNGTHWNVQKQGNFRIEVNFSAPLDEAINCIVYAEFDSLLQIDGNKNTSIDFNN